MRKEKYKNILCFGEVLWDMLPGNAKPGGAPLNVAIHLKRQNLDPIIISKTGNDKIGKELIDFLEESGVKTNNIQKDDLLPTSQVLVELDKNKNATYEICEPVAWDNILIYPELEELAKKADLIIYGSLASRNQTTRATLLHLLKISPALRLVDVNLRSPSDNREWIETLLRISNFAKLNDDELIKIADWNNIKGDEKELTRWFSKFYNCPSVCVTRGKNGALLYFGSKIFEHPGFKIKAVDTVGAGDSFLASLVGSLSKNIDPEKALEKANATGAFVASQKGAVPDYTEKDIEAIIHTRQ